MGIELRATHILMCFLFSYHRRRDWLLLTSNRCISVRCVASGVSSQGSPELQKIRHSGQFDDDQVRADLGISTMKAVIISTDKWLSRNLNVSFLKIFFELGFISHSNTKDSQYNVNQLTLTICAIDGAATAFPTSSGSPNFTSHWKLVWFSRV